MVYSEYTRQRILSYWFNGLKPGSSTLKLKEEGINISRVSVWKFIKFYQVQGTIHRKPGSAWPTKITDEVSHIVGAKMAEDDETMAVQLQNLLVENGHQVSLHSILQSQTKLGWTFKGNTYCKFIWDVNNMKRLEWAWHNLQASQSNGFQEVQHIVGNPQTPQL